MPDVDTGSAGGKGPPDVPPDSPPESSEDLAGGLPTGPPLYLWFGGILEGKRRSSDDDATLRGIVDAINRLGLGRAELEIDGGTFSVLMVETTLAGDRVRQEQREAFVRHLQEILDTVGPAAGVESTLRCTEVFADRTAESLFAPMGAEMRSVGRLRETNESDRRHAPVSESAIGSGLSRIGRRNALITLALAVPAELRAGAEPASQTHGADEPRRPVLRA